MEMPNDNILEKIRALLRLASDSGATEHEASLAMERAQALLLKHNLDMADIDVKDDGFSFEVLDEEFNIGKANWRSTLLGMIARQNFCRVITHTGTGRPPSIIGRKYNIEVVQELSLWLAGQLDSLVMADINAREFLGEFVDRTWKDSFLYGAINRIKERLIEANSNNDGQTQALVVCLDEENNSFIKDAYPNLGSRSYSILNAEAYNQGVSAGNTVSVMPSRRQVR